MTREDVRESDRRRSNTVKLNVPHSIETPIKKFPEAVGKRANTCQSTSFEVLHPLLQLSPLGPPVTRRRVSLVYLRIFLQADPQLQWQLRPNYMIYLVFPQRHPKVVYFSVVHHHQSQDLNVAEIKKAYRKKVGTLLFLICSC